MDREPASLEESRLTGHGKELTHLSITSALSACLDKPASDSLPSEIGMNRETPYLGETPRIDLEGAAPDDLLPRLSHEERLEARYVVLDKFLWEVGDQFPDGRHFSGPCGPDKDSTALRGVQTTRAFRQTSREF